MPKRKRKPLAGNVAPAVALRRKQQWDEAVLRSLDAFAADGRKISVKAVVEAACYEDGQKVGSSTAYDKHEGRYVHEAILERIRQARAEQVKSAKKDIRTADDNKDQRIRSLKAERKSLVDDLVSLRAQLLECQEENGLLRRRLLQEKLSSYVYGRSLIEIGASDVALANKVAGFEESREFPRKDEKKRAEMQEEIRSIVLSARTIRASSPQVVTGKFGARALAKGSLGKAGRSS